MLYQYLVRLYLIAALLQLGMTLTDVETCSGRQCLSRLDKAKAAVLKIEWKPISVFPKESVGFR